MNRFTKKPGSAFIIFPAVLIFLLSSSCYPIKYVDVSSDPAFSPLVGKNIILKQDVWALGGSNKFRAQPPADFVCLAHGVGYSNRHVVSRDRLKKGTVLQITGVLSAGHLVYRIREIGSNQLHGMAEVQIDLAGKSNDANLGLDSRYYEAGGSAEACTGSAGKRDVAPHEKAGKVSVPAEKNDIKAAFMPRCLLDDAAGRGFEPLPDPGKLYGRSRRPYKFRYYDCRECSSAVYLANKKETGDDVWLVVYGKAGGENTCSACPSEVNLGKEYGGPGPSISKGPFGSYAGSTEKSEGKANTPCPIIRIDFDGQYDHSTVVFCFEGEWWMQKGDTYR